MKKIKFYSVVICLFPLLSACLSPEQIRANQIRAQQEAQYRQQQAMNNIRSKCDGYGFMRGTPAFAQCVQQEVNRAESCNASKSAIEDRIQSCRSQCFINRNLTPMECDRRCYLNFGGIPNC
jgi:hypothetical protein